MGCFSIFPCFKTSKHRKVKQTHTPITSSLSPTKGIEKKCEPVLVTIPTQESTYLDSFQKSIWEPRDNSGDQLINEKGVSLDLDVRTCADPSIEKAGFDSVESKEKDKVVKEESGTLGVLVQIENEKEREKEDYEVNENLGVLVEIENEKELKEEKENLGFLVELEFKKEREKEVKKQENINEVQSQNQAFSDSSVSSYISYPPMHRYHNCLIDEEEDHVLIQDESSESLFSLPMDSRRQSKSIRAEIDEKEVNSPLKIACLPNKIDQNQSVEAKLNPIENLTQWKTLKARKMPTLDCHQEKENVNLEPEVNENPVSKGINLKHVEQEKLKSDIAVTTSLSSWLIESEKTPTKSKGDSQSSTGNSYSWKSFEDRPILGALTIEELRQMSVNSTPRKSPHRNPDEMPIIGTVGSYWSHTGQATDSSNSFSSPREMSGKSRRNREDKIPSCQSTPFRARLERALDKGIA